MTGAVYKHGDIVWCKCGGLYWPGEVQSIDSLPTEIREGFIKIPKVVVKFFDEDGYEFVLNDRDIFPYSCEKKNDFIAKGLARLRTKTKEGVATDGWYAKFPKDIVKCEKLTNGNVRILEEEPFVERKEKRVDYSLIFGDQTEDGSKKSGSKKTKQVTDTATANVNGSQTPSMSKKFGGSRPSSTHTVRILSQPSTPYHMAGSAFDSSPQPPVPPRYTCHICGFATSRLNVIVLHTKSHSEPHRTNLANHARDLPDKSTSKCAIVRKRVVSPKVRGESVLKKPRLTKKQKELKKEEERGREEKKKAIFGDWSEDEIEEIEEKEKLKESIANKEEKREDNDIDDMFNFTDDHHLIDSEDEHQVQSSNPSSVAKSKPLRRRKVDLESFVKEQEKPKVKRKVYEKPTKNRKSRNSAADAINTLIKSKLTHTENNTVKQVLSPQKTDHQSSRFKKTDKFSMQSEMGSSNTKSSSDVAKILSETKPPVLPKLPDKSSSTVPQSPADVFDGNFSGSDSAGTFGSSADELEPASPPSTKKPGILRKSSHLSIQLPTRPNGNSVVIRHESNSPTKYAAISAKAKAKQLARNAQLSEEHKADVSTDTDSSKVDEKVKLINSDVDNSDSTKHIAVEKVNVVAIGSTVNTKTVASSSVTKSSSVSPIKSTCSTIVVAAASTATSTNVKLSPATTIISPTKSSPKKILVEPTVKTVSVTKDAMPAKSVTVTVGQAVSPVKSSVNVVRMVHNNPMILPKSPTNTVFLQKAGTTQMILPKSTSRPVLLPKTTATTIRTVQTSPLLPKSPKPVLPKVMRSPNSKPTIITVGKSTTAPVINVNKSPITTKSLSMNKSLLSPTSKPVVVGPPTIVMSSPKSTISLDKPVVAGVSKPVVGGISLAKPSKVALVSPSKDEKALTVSLDAKRPSTVMERSKVPVVKTVELPRRVVEATRQPAKAVTPQQPVTPTVAEVEVSKPLVLAADQQIATDNLAAISQLQMLGDDAGGDGDMIYLLVDDTTDPSLALENQTLYIDQSQLAAALGPDLGGGVILQGYGTTGPLVLQQTSSTANNVVIQDTEGQMHLVMPDKVGVIGSVLPPPTTTLGPVTSADTSGGIATLPAHPSSSLLAQVPLITTPSQQGPIMVASTSGDEQS